MFILFISLMVLAVPPDKPVITTEQRPSGDLLSLAEGENLTALCTACLEVAGQLTWALVDQFDNPLTSSVLDTTRAVTQLEANTPGCGRRARSTLSLMMRLEFDNTRLACYSRGKATIGLGGADVYSLSERLVLKSQGETSWEDLTFLSLVLLTSAMACPLLVFGLLGRAQRKRRTSKTIRGIMLRVRRASSDAVNQRKATITKTSIRSWASQSTYGSSTVSLKTCPKSHYQTITIYTGGQRAYQRRCCTSPPFRRAVIPCPTVIRRRRRRYLKRDIRYINQIQAAVRNLFMQRLRTARQRQLRQARQQRNRQVPDCTSFSKPQKCVDPSSYATNLGYTSSTRERVTMVSRGSHAGPSRQRASTFKLNESTV